MSASAGLNRAASLLEPAIDLGCGCSDTAGCGGGDADFSLFVKLLDLAIASGVFSCVGGGTLVTLSVRPRFFLFVKASGVLGAGTSPFVFLASS